MLPFHRPGCRLSVRWLHRTPPLLVSPHPEIIRTIRDRSEPLFITQSGEAKAVMQDIDSHEQTQENLALLRMLALGNRQIDAGQVHPAHRVIARLRESLQTD